MSLLASLVGEVMFRAYSPGDSDRSAQLAGSLVRTARFSSLSADKGQVRGKVLRVYYPAVCRAAEKLGMTVEMTGQSGAYYFLKRYSRRTGILIGALLAAALTVFFSNIVMRIEISGNENVSDDEILAILRGTGIYYGSFIPAVDMRAAENILLASSEEISWAGVRSSGCRVIVQVTETAGAPDVVPKGSPCNIVAVRDAQITGMSVYSGMVIPMLGDTVRRGEVLISGVVPKKFSGTYYVHAMGKITGRYSETVSFVQPFEDTAEVCGDPDDIICLELFGKRFRISGRMPAGRCETAEDIRYIRFLGLTLPAAVVHCEVWETEEVPVRYSREQADELLDGKLSRYENNFLSGGGSTVIDRRIYRSYTESGAEIRAEYIIEGDIGEERIIFLDK